MSRHYIRIDGEIIIHGFSDAFETPLNTDICINENGGRQFELLGETNPAMTNANGTHRFRYVEVIIPEVVKVTEDVSSEVVVDTSGVELDDKDATLSDIQVNTTAMATGYKTIEHSNMIVRYATEEELSDELATIPVVDPEPTEIELLQAQVNTLQAQNDMLTECILEMSEVVYGGI